MVGNEDDTVVGLDEEAKQSPSRLALYPIALNGGGAGLYSDPREFATNATTVSGGGFSRNHRTEGARRAPVKSHVRFAWPYERKRDAANDGGTTSTQQQQHHHRVEGQVDLEAGYQLKQTPSTDIETESKRQSLSSMASSSIINPWKIWENIHNEMSRLALLRTRRAEDESSHVTLARQKNKAARVSSIYNDDDFDFALVLAPHDAYAFWARHLDFREEALHFVEEEDGGLDELLLNGGGGGDGDDASTIATATCEGAIDVSRTTDKSPNTPIDSSGLRRRKTAATPSSDNKLYSSSKTSSINRFSTANNNISPVPSGRHPSHLSPYRVRTGERLGNRTFNQRKSLFERALSTLSPPREDGIPSRRNLMSSNKHDKSHDNENDKAFPTPSSATKRSAMSPYVPRRRWGNAYDTNKLSTPNLTSPPIVSLKKSKSAQKRLGGSNMFPWKVPGSGATPHGGTRRRALTADDVDKKLGCESGSVTKSGKRSREIEDLDVSALEKDGEDVFFSSPGIPRGIGESMLV